VSPAIGTCRLGIHDVHILPLRYTSLRACCQLSLTYLKSHGSRAHSKCGLRPSVLLSTFSSLTTISPKMSHETAKAGTPTERGSELNVYGSFTPTHPASPSLKFFTRSASATFSRRPALKPLQLTWSQDSDLHDSEASSPRSTDTFLSTMSDVPSISRTSPYHSQRTSAASSTTLIDDRSALPPLDAKLVAVERASKFCAKSLRCSCCGKIGADFPRCGKCGEMWCSRQCRLSKGRHSCASLNNV
jgi:hypothetical protein